MPSGDFLCIWFVFGVCVGICLALYGKSAGLFEWPRLQKGKVSSRQMGDTYPPFISDVNWEFGASH